MFQNAVLMPLFSSHVTINFGTPRAFILLVPSIPLEHDFKNHRAVYLIAYHHNIQPIISRLDVT